MNTKELQESIIQKIRRSKDDELLNYLNQLLSNEDDQKTYKLSDFEKNILAEGEADYLAGRIIENEHVLSRNKEWLKIKKKDKMTDTIELKNILHDRIASINDQQLLSAVITLLNAKSEALVYKTTDEQKASIMEGREQIANGDFFTNEQVEKEIDEWLSKK